MEELLNITIHDIEPRVKEFLEKPAGAIKNVEYYERIQGIPIRRTSLLKKDGNLYFSSTHYTIKRNMQSYYLKPKDKVGFTLNEKGKLSIWFGKSVQQIQSHIYSIFQELHIDWVKQLPDNYCQFITKITLEKILNGKITNPIDFCNQLLKNWRVKGASPRILYNTMMAPSKHNTSNFLVTKFTKGVSVAKNFDHYMEYLAKKINVISRYSEEDLEMQAIILDRKIDYTWSEKRMEDEHQKWTKEIMLLKRDNLSKEPISKLKWFIDNDHLLSNHFTLLETESELFDEGNDMSHCIYTNYFNYVKRGGYVAYHVTYQGEDVTVGIYVRSTDLTIDQIQAKRNTSSSAIIAAFIRNALVPLFNAYKHDKPYLVDNVKELAEETLELPF